jgi:hypothetical protein
MVIQNPHILAHSSAIDSRDEGIDNMSLFPALLKQCLLFVQYLTKVSYPYSSIGRHLYNVNLSFEWMVGYLHLLRPSPSW